MSITIVTGFFDIKRDTWKNYQRTNNEYFEYFTKWATVKNKMVVFVDNEELAKMVEDFRESISLGKMTKVIVVPNCYDIDKNLFKSISEVTDNKIHQSFRLQPNNPEVVNAKYDYVMLLKEWCVSEAVSNHYAEGIIAWVDFGYNHGGETIQPSSFDGFIWDYDFPNDKVCLFNNNKVDINNPIFNVVRTMDVFIMGTIIVAPDFLWAHLWDSVRSLMMSLCDCGLVDDDQTILLMYYYKYTEQCQLFSSSWNKQMIDYNLSSSKLIEIEKRTTNCKLKILAKKIRKSVKLFVYCVKQFRIIK